ncbi:MAG: hypothetical protein AAGB26_00650 [Planctomycetota bacterium]
MTIRIAICAILFASLGTSASATWKSWGDWHKWDGWKQADRDWQKIGDYIKDKVNDVTRDRRSDHWSRDGKKWEEDCGWGRDDNRKNKKKGKKNGRKGKGKKDKCDPHVVPSPTAAIAGLGVMGLMLS